MVSKKLKQMAKYFLPEKILETYRTYAANVIIKGTGDRALFDFVTGDGAVIGQMLSQFASQSLSVMVSHSNSDFVAQGSTKAFRDLGALNGLAVIYYPNEKDPSVINKALGTANVTVFNSLVSMGALSGVTKSVDDKKYNLTVNRLSVPTMKSMKTAKLNVFKDLLYGKDGKSLYTGPLFKFEEVSNAQDIQLSYTNSNGIPIDTALFVPLAFYVVIEELFTQQIFQSENVKGMIQAAIASSVPDSGKVVEALASGANINWGKRHVARERSITLSSKVLRLVYGKETDELLQKINKRKAQLGLNFPSLRFSFYDLRGSYDSYELQSIDPLTFKCLSDYTRANLNTDINAIKKSSKCPKFVLVSLYRETVDYIMTNKLDIPELWTMLNIPESVLEKDKFGVTHQNYVYGAFKYTSSDLYSLLCKLNKLLEGFTKLEPIDTRINKKMTQFGLSTYKTYKVELSDDMDTRLKTVKDALSQNICYVDYTNKKGQTTRHTLTTNESILTHVFGDDYIGKYGSLKKRVETFKYGVEHSSTMNDLRHYVVKTGILDLANKEVVDKKGNKLGTNPPPPVMTTDFNKYKQALIEFADGLIIPPTATRNTIVPESPEKQKVVGISLAATPKTGYSDLDGSKDFYTFLEIGSISGVYRLK